MYDTNRTARSLGDEKVSWFDEIERIKNVYFTRSFGFQVAM
jgi:hypothetical protein